MKQFLIPILFLTIGLQSCKEQPVSYPNKQVSLARVEAMADVPQPLKIIDYRALALNFDKTIYDFNATGDFWPMIWWDSSGKNFQQPVIGMYTAIGDVRQGPHVHQGMFHESLATMGGVLGATLVGIDKSNQNGLNYVAMLKNYFNKENNWNIMMNNTNPTVALLGGGYGRDWWYDVFPNVLFYAIYDKYPNEPEFDRIALSIANKFYSADSILAGNYNYSFFDYGAMKPMSSHICAQQDVAAGHAYVLYAAYKKFKDPRYLKGAQSAMKALSAQNKNPSYEVLMPFGAYMAARMNAETSTDYSIDKMLEWTFDGTPICREGWGILTGNWNGYDISGIMGSTVDHGGYGFLMNTYDAAWPLIPMIRYNTKYAATIGKWILNAANAARFFYPAYLPAEHQTIPALADATKGVIGYEGLVQRSTFEKYASIKAPVAQGDGPKWIAGNPDVSQFSVYGSAHVGIFGGMLRNTNVEGILQVNLLTTDFFREDAFPTFLYYNPFNNESEVTLSIEGLTDKIDLYDAVADSIIAKNVTNGAKLHFSPGQAIVLVCLPVKSALSIHGNVRKANGVVINYVGKEMQPPINTSTSQQ